MGIEGCEFADWQRQIVCRAVCGQTVRQGWRSETMGQTIRRFGWRRVRAETPRSKRELWNRAAREERSQAFLGKESAGR